MQIDRVVLRAREVDDAERTQRLAISTREIVTDDDRQVQRLGHTFDPAYEIDSGADHGEIEPIDSADIAIDCGAGDVPRGWTSKSNRIGW